MNHNPEQRLDDCDQAGARDSDCCSVGHHRDDHRRLHDGCCGHDHGEEAALKQPRVLNAGVQAANRTTLRVAGMDCADEVAAIERELKPLAGVGEVRVNLMRSTVAIGHDAIVTSQQLIQVIGRTGLQAQLADESADSGGARSDRRARVIAVVVSGLFTATALILEWSLVAPGWCIAAAVCAIIAGGWFVLPKAVSAVRRWSLDMNVLMTVAVLGAAAIGQWAEAAAVVFLFSLSELLEALSLGRARRAIQSLMQLSPDTALLKRGSTFEEVPVAEVKVNDMIAVKSGSRIPLDGEVSSGSSSVNQAPITGESLPVEKKPGDTVFAGTINGEGSLEVRVTKLSTDTTLARIIHLVEEAQSQKAPSQRFVDVFARYYTPSVFALALVVWLAPPLVFGGAWLVWTYRALVLLVIACPCALVVSTPVSIVSGITAMARRGVLIKGGTVLEAVGKLTALAVDKTGTITEGKPRVTHVATLNSKPENELLRIAAAIDAHSKHPLAQAVVNHANEKGIEFPRSTNYRARQGRGAEGEVDGCEYFVGNHRFAHELGVCSEDLERRLTDIEADAQSVVVLGHKPHGNCPGEALGLLAVGDTIRPDAARAMRSLHAAGVKKVVMLSGDNQQTAEAIARQAGMDEAWGDLLPEQKVDRVRQLRMQYKHVGMIGDGVNDAPAMALANVGIAMGAAGTDAALETADLALMQDDLCEVGKTIQLGRRTVRIIQANIAFALGVKALFLVLAIMGHTSLWLAILADDGAALIVIASALRLLKDSNAQKRGGLTAQPQVVT